MSMKNANDTIGNQTHHLPVCSAVPQPTGPLCTPYSTNWTKNNLPHHCITDKDWYIQVVTLYMQQDLKYGLVVKDKRNMNIYLFNVPNLQILI